MDSKDAFTTRVVEIDKIKTDKSVVICGFLGSTPAGNLTASYLIGEKKMHEVAHVRSPYLTPVAVFIGGKLRHPFRVYSGMEGKVIVMTCDIPIGPNGLYEISSAVIDWLQTLNISELVVLEGIPVDEVPDKRKTYGLAEPEGLAKLKSNGIEIADSALVTGMGGALISECLSRKITASSLLTPMFVGYPDPETVLSLISALNKLYAIDASVDNLKEQVKKMHQEMNKIMDHYRSLKEEKTKDTDSLYM